MALLFLFLFHMSLLLFLSGYTVVFSIVLEYATRMIGVDVDYSSGSWYLSLLLPGAIVIVIVWLLD